MVENESKTVKLHTNKAEGKNLSELVQEFIEGFDKPFPETFAILYSPSHCFLAMVDEKGNVEVKDNADKLDLNKVFEARIFNKKAELRWFNDNGKGIAATLSETEIDEKFGGEICLANPQNYLLWGEVSPTNQASENWTEFAEARIGKFHVPIKTTSRAHFTAVEYLCEFADGNVAVLDERLTGISEVK